MVAEQLVERRRSLRSLDPQTLREQLVERRAVLAGRASVGGELDQDVLEAELAIGGAARPDQPLPLKRVEMPLDEGARLLRDQGDQHVDGKCRSDHGGASQQIALGGSQSVEARREERVQGCRYRDRALVLQCRNELLREQRVTLRGVDDAGPRLQN
ncbi:MAG: hypothetical protein ACRDF0_07395 [Candidatus Limnocylindria bacterium]